MSADDTRTRILNAAGPVFAEQGFAKATVREICNLAQVNLASVNYHFGGKERLYIEAIKHIHHRRVEQNPLPNWPPGTSAKVRLKDFVQNMVTSMQSSDESSWETRLMTREMMHPSGACRELVEDFVRPHFGMLLSILQELVPKGLPEHRLQQLGFSVIGQCTFYRFHREVIRLLIPREELQQFFTPQNLAAHITEVVLAGATQLKDELAVPPSVATHSG